MCSSTRERGQWYAQADPAERLCQSRPSGTYARRRNILANEANDVIHRSPGLEDRGYAPLFEIRNVLVGNDSADDNEHIVHSIVSQEIHHARHDGIVRARENRKADYLYVFL